MWRSVFLHEFLDEEIRNFQALPGTLTPASLTLTPGSDPSFPTNSVQIIPGRGFEYSLAQPLDEVIGVSGRVRLRYPIQRVTSQVPILRVGNMAEFRVQPLPVLDPTASPSDLAAPARALLRIGSTNVELGLLVLPHRLFVDVRFDWHTSGQARLLLNGRLVGYQNAVAPAAQFEVANVTFGLPNAPPSDTNPRYQIGRVFVRVLRRSDSLAAFSRLLPIVDVPDNDLFRRCQLRATISVSAMVDRLRQFMALVNQNLSQSWSQNSGPSEGPFSPEAVAAHELATNAVVELGRMLRTGDFSTPDGFLRPFTDFLIILHDALPNEFEALAKDLTATTVVTEECRQVLEAALEQGRRPQFGPLFDLLSAASGRIREIAGVS